MSAHRGQVDYCFRGCFQANKPAWLSRLITDLLNDSGFTEPDHYHYPIAVDYAEVMYHYHICSRERPQRHIAICNLRQHLECTRYHWLMDLRFFEAYQGHCKSRIDLLVDKLRRDPLRANRIPEFNPPESRSYGPVVITWRPGKTVQELLDEERKLADYYNDRVEELKFKLGSWL